MEDNILLEIQKTSAGSVQVDAQVDFDTVITSLGDVTYDTGSGVITFNRVGRYLINWWIATRSSLSANEIVFSLVSSQGDDIIGNSPIKTGEVYGTAIINVETAPATLSLINQSLAEIFYSTQVPVKATMTIVEQPVGPTTGSIIPINSSYMYIYNDSENDSYDINTIIPVESTLENVTLSARLTGIDIDPTFTGTLHYSIYTTPLGSSTETLVLTGDFTPTINETTPIDTILVANSDVSIPIAAGDTVTVRITYTTDGGPSSAVELELTGGLYIVPSA